LFPEVIVIQEKLRINLKRSTDCDTNIRHWNMNWLNSVTHIGVGHRHVLDTRHVFYRSVRCYKGGRDKSHTLMKWKFSLSCQSPLKTTLLLLLLLSAYNFHVWMANYFHAW